jgi:hypothetical protein
VKEVFATNVKVPRVETVLHQETGVPLGFTLAGKSSVT